MKVIPLPAAAITPDSVPISPAVAYLKSLNSPTSRLTMISPLNRAARIMNPALDGKNAWKFIPWQNLRATHVRAVMSEIIGSPATRNKALAALKGVCQAAWELRLLDTDELMRIKSVKGDSGSRELAGRFIPDPEISDILRVCSQDSGPAGARDAAMISLAVCAGVRRAEIVSILSENVMAEEDGGYRIRLIGKRNRERMVFVSSDGGRTLDDWIKLRFDTGVKTGPLFCRILKNGRIEVKKGISPTAADSILRKRCKQAALSDLDWHDLRRTTASNLLDAGVDIATVSGILGHSSIQTTARYDRRGERVRKKAVEAIKIPYFRRSSPPAL